MKPFVKIIENIIGVFFWKIEEFFRVVKLHNFRTKYKPVGRIVEK